MDSYTVRVGTKKHKKPAQSYNDLLYLPTRCVDDDGLHLEHVGNISPTCPDCKRGTLQWAEAGYVPWHRICDHCGSHWDLHPVDFFLRREAADEPEDVPPSLPQQRWLVDLPESGPLASDEHLAHVQSLAAKIAAEHIERAVAECGGGVPVVTACWARRARFYSR